MLAKLTPEEEAALNRVREDCKDSEDYLRQFRQDCNDYYREYRIVANARDDARRSPRDLDDIAESLADDFNRQVHVPIAYSTVETLVPRTVQNRPRGLVLPDERTADENVENMRLVVTKQQSAMSFELLSQDLCKSSFISGLAVVKGPYWRREVQAGMPVIQRATSAEISGSPFVVATQDRVLYDDAWGEEVDIRDFFWDRWGYNATTLRWNGHRIWRDDNYVADQFGLTPGRELPDRSQAPWNTLAAQQITAEDIKAIAVGQQSMDAAWREKEAIAGNGSTNEGREKLHEIIEYWTARGEVITILDRQIPVKIARNPFWHGRMPFHFFRPQTSGARQLHGISEIEGLAEQIAELNLIKTARKKNLLLALQRVLIFDEDAVDRDDLVYGPGIAIPVRSDDPRAHLYPMDQPDIPFASYREEEAIKADMDRTSGISDTVTGAEGSGVAQTATGAQLLVTAAGIRIEAKTHRFELETVKPFTDQQIALVQQMIVEKDIRIPREPQPGEIDPKPWQWVTLNAAELAGAMSFEVEGGSMAPKNLAQEAQMGQNLWNTLRDDPHVDQMRLRRHFLESQGVKSVGSWLLPQPNVPPAFADLVAKEIGDAKAKRLLQLAAEGGQQ